MTDSLKEKGKQFLVKHGYAPEKCAVKGCRGRDVEVIKLRPLDPIDHESTLLQLCPHHQDWAAQRNQLAAEVKAELVEARKKIGQERIGEIQSLAMPQDGDLREDILMGETEERYVPLDDAFEDGGESA